MPLTPFLRSFTRGLATRAKAVMGRAHRGLYDGKHIQFGNRISFANNKSRRTWKPNVQHKKFWSETYQRLLSFRVTTSTIKKVKQLAGGIDDYLMSAPSHLLLYDKAIKIKKNMLREHQRRAAGQGAFSQYRPKGSMPATSEL